MKLSYLLLALLVSSAYSQTLVNRIVLDNFSEGSQNIIITLPAGVNSGNPFIQTSIYQSSLPDPNTNIIGGERDIEVTVTQGTQNLLVTAQVFTGSNEQYFAVSTPQGAAALDLLQYDGTDNSLNLDITGLAPSLRDLTDGGLAVGITFTLLTDIVTNYDFFFYDTAGGICTHTQDIQPTAVFQNFQVPFTTFQGNCDFTDIGAVEFQVDGANNVDTLIGFFGVYGVVPDSPSPSPSVSRAPSPSRSPSRSRSRSRSASRSTSLSRTPSPVFEPECNCNCPVFRCGLVYAVPPGDDDSSNDDSIYFPGYDDDIVYRPVYYHAIDDDFDGFVGDDDHDNLSMRGGLVVNAWEREEDDEGIWYPDDAAARYLSSGSNVLTLSLTLLAAIGIAVAI